MVREEHSHAIISTDTNTYNNYMKMIETKKKEKHELRDAVREINSLKTEMHEIKSLLIKMMDRN